MRWIAPLLVAGFVHAAAQAEELPAPRIVKLGDRVHVLLGPVQHANRANQGFMINATVVVGDQGVMLIDSGGSDEVGRHIASAVRRITPKPVTHVVNTHHHGDHYLGNAAFAGAKIISSEKCRELVAETGAEWLGMMEQDVGRKLPGTKVLAADITYRERVTPATINGVRVVFLVPKGSHTAGDLLVHLPDDGVLVAGDVLVNGIVPTLQDGYLGNWIGTLDEIRELRAAHFIPGHGDPMGAADVDALRDALARFHAGVKAGYRRGLTEVEMRQSLDLAAWEKLERSYVIGRNIARAYLEVEREIFDEK